MIRNNHEKCSLKLVLSGTEIIWDSERVKEKKGIVIEYNEWETSGK